MQSEKIWEDLSALPTEAQRQVIDFIDFLAQRYAPKEDKRKPNRQSLSTEPFVGMWQGRADLEDSVEWVRSLREKEWSRRGG